MPSIRSCPLPEAALLHRHARSGAYTDCYATEVPGPVSLAQFVEAFYTTRLFKLERWLLAKVIARPSTDAQAGQLARGEITQFAAWTVEGRQADQLMLAAGVTRSWLMTVPSQRPGVDHTTLYFGSAVMPMGGRSGLRWGFQATLGFHVVYSRLLLGAARRRLASQQLAQQRPPHSGPQA